MNLPLIPYKCIFPLRTDKMFLLDLQTYSTFSVHDSDFCPVICSSTLTFRVMFISELATGKRKHTTHLQVQVQAQLQFQTQIQIQILI